MSVEVWWSLRRPRTWRTPLRSWTTRNWMDATSPSQRTVDEAAVDASAGDALDTYLPFVCLLMNLVHCCCACLWLWKWFWWPALQLWHGLLRVVCVMSFCGMDGSSHNFLYTALIPFYASFTLTSINNIWSCVRVSVYYCLHSKLVQDSQQKWTKQHHFQ